MSAVAASPVARAAPAAHPADPGGWVPTPVCGPGCLPAPTPCSRRERWRVARRMTALVALLLVGTVVLALLGARAVPRACRLMLRAVGVRVVVRGEPGTSAALLVANHASWVEVVALSSVRPARLLAKREVRDWPVVGALAARAGAVFLDRARLRSLPGTVAATAAVLRGEGAVAAFPEGTTWCGAAAGPLRPAVFQAALDAAVPVRPVAVVLRAPDGRRAPEAAFVGDQTLADTLVRAMRLPHVTCELTFLPAIAPVGTRGELAARAADAIAAVTGVMHPVRGADPLRRAVTLAGPGVAEGVVTLAGPGGPGGPGGVVAVAGADTLRGAVAAAGRGVVRGAVAAAGRGVVRGAVAVAGRGVVRGAVTVAGPGVAEGAVTLGARSGARCPRGTVALRAPAHRRRCG